MDYSFEMGAVDWTDVLLSYVQCICKCEMVQEIGASYTEHCIAQCTCTYLMQSHAQMHVLVVFGQKMIHPLTCNI